MAPIGPVNRRRVLASDDAARARQSLIETLAKQIARADTRGHAGVALTLRLQDGQLSPRYAVLGPASRLAGRAPVTAHDVAARWLRPMVEQISLSRHGTYHLDFVRDKRGALQLARVGALAPAEREAKATKTPRTEDAPFPAPTDHEAYLRGVHETRALVFRAFAKAIQPLDPRRPSNIIWAVAPTALFAALKVRQVAQTVRAANVDRLLLRGAGRAAKAARPPTQPPTTARLFGRKVASTRPHAAPGSGRTDWHGNYWYSTAGSAKDQKLARYHEQVHSVLSPRLRLGRDVRARIKELGFQRSTALRYIEEALAEAVAQLRVNGLRGLPRALRHPMQPYYRIKVGRLLGEVALGALTLAGVTYAVKIVCDDAGRYFLDLSRLHARVRMQARTTPER
ncbi:MAG: hypothetical protein KC503_06350 [Myxococcales bacterium]|nr:hypothetical protein [Myxococcales bacterium]